MTSEAQSDLVRDMLDRVKEIKSRFPVLSAEVDGLEEELRSLMQSIKAELASLDTERERKLMTVYLINVVHRAIDEIVVE